jgi:hypothetical protein
MDGVLWILIGLAGGAIIATLSTDSRQRSMSASGWRRIGTAATGAVGALLGGSALVLRFPALRTDGLTTAAAALAGALWLSWVVAISIGRRRQGDDAEPAAEELSHGAVPYADMPAYDATRQALVEGLSEDAAAHDAGRYAEVGRQFAAVRTTLVRQDAAQGGRLHVALRFWHGWMLARDDRWPGDDSPDPMIAADWPQFARGIASDLALDRDITNPRVAARFGHVAPSLIGAGHSASTIATSSTS